MTKNKRKNGVKEKMGSELFFHLTAFLGKK